MCFFLIFLLHICATWWGLVNMQGQCDHLMVHFLSGFTFYTVSSSTMLKVTWNPEWIVILRSVGRYRKAFDSRSWYVHGFSPRLVLLRHVTSRELIRHSCCDDMGLMPVGKSESLHILVSVYSELCGTQRVESLQCGNEFTLKVYGYQLHNGQLRQSHMLGFLSSILSYVGFDTDMPGRLCLSVKCNLIQGSMG